MPSLLNARIAVVLLALCTTAGLGACGGGGQEEATAGLAVLDASSGARIEGSISFAPVTVGEQASRSVILRNESARPVTLEGLSFIGEPSPHFSFSDGLSARALGLGESVTLQLAFRPQAPGDFVAALAMRVRDARGERVEHLALEGKALPPEGVERHRAVMSAPAQLELGRVPFVAELEHEKKAQAQKTRVLRIFNAGGSESRFSLHAVEVEALDEGTQRDELTVLPEAGESAESIGAGDSLPVRVSVRPVSLGPKAWRLTFHAREPEVAPLVVSITAESTVPGHCRLFVPSSLDLGVVSPPKPRSAELLLRNLGQSPDEACVVWGFSFASGQEPAPFEVIDAEGAFLLEPGEERSVTVRTRPLPQGTHEATLRFRTTSKDRPLVEVPVVVRAPVSNCLVLTPDELDFGSVWAAGCELQRTFHLYNACPEPFTLRGYRVPAAAGQLAGGPECPGTEPCPEFTLVQAPAVPPGGLVLQPGAPPLAFLVRYQPLDYGADTGGIALDVDVGAGEPPVTYVVALKGRADSQGSTFDAYTQYTPPKLDLLLVLDSSQAMSAHEAITALNLQDMGVALGDPWRFDARVAVVTGDPADGLAFRTGALHPAAVLASGMPDFAAQFAEKVDVGRSGSSAQSCLGRAVAVLSAPENAGAGLLRPGVPFTVLCLFGSPDSSGGTAAAHVTALLSASGKTPAQLSITALGPVGPFCGGDTGLFAELESSPHAYVDEICTSDIRPSPGPFYSMRSRFPLSWVPRSADELTVSVNGVSTPSVLSDGRAVWTYDPVGNAVIFEPQHVPLPGSSIAVIYQLACY